MLVKLILFVLPFLRIESALTNTTAAYGDSQIITTGVWTKADTGCGYSTSKLNSSVSLTFNGVSIHVLGDLGLYGGTVQITLDGQPTRLIANDPYGDARCGQVLFSRTGLTNGQHFINLKLTGESPNVTSTNGPARLFVFKNFIWSSLTPNPSSSLSPSPSTKPPSRIILWKRQSTATPPPVVSPPPVSPPPVVSPPPPPPVVSPPPPPVVSPPPPPVVSPPPPPVVSPPPPVVSPSPVVSPPPVVSPVVSPPPVVSPSPSVSSVSVSSVSSLSPSLFTSRPSSSLSSSLSTSRSSSSLPTSRPSSSLSPSPSTSRPSSSLSPSPPLPPLSSSRLLSSLAPSPSRPPSNSPTESPPRLSPSSTTSSYRLPKYTTPPTSTLPSESVPTVTAVASGPPPDLSGVIQLWTCKPYGPKDCVFNPQVSGEVNTHSLIVGTPAKNCGGTADSVAVVGGQLTISDTWSQDLTAGLSLGGAAGDLRLNTSGTELWENSKGQYLSQVVKMTIPPNSQGALVAQVAYDSTNGTMQIGNGVPFTVIANRPHNDVEYVANVIPCDAEFNGNYTPSLLPSAATQSMKPYSYAIVVIVALAVHILL